MLASVSRKQIIANAAFMLRGSLPPAICLFLLRTDHFTQRYGTEGHVSAIIAFLGCAFLPRARQIQHIVLSVLFTCLGACITLLAMYCGIKARHGSKTQEGKPGYNSAQAAVCALWLFVDIWLFSMLRARTPSIAPQVFIQNVYAMVLMSFAPRFATMHESIIACRSLLELFLIGLATATGVGLLVLPLNTSTIVRNQEHALILKLGATLKQQAASLTSIKSNLQAAHSMATAEAKNITLLTPAAGSLFSLDMEIAAGLRFAEREIIWTRFSAGDLHDIEQLLCRIIKPVSGMSLIVGLIEHWPSMRTQNTIQAAYRPSRLTPSLTAKLELVDALEEYFRSTVSTLNRDLQDVAQHLQVQTSNGASTKISLRSLQTSTPDKSPTDLAGGKKDIDQSQDAIAAILARERPAFEDTTVSGDDEALELAKLLKLSQYLALLADRASYAIHQLQVYSESKQSPESWRKRRIVYPNPTQLKAWAAALWRDSAGLLVASPDTAHDYRTMFHSIAQDPEHLSTATTWEKSSANLRKIAHLFGSPASVFGFRVALATLSGTIMAFLQQTYDFYFDQRIIWCAIVIVVGWHMTTGQSVFALLWRVIATVVSMCMSWIVWYVPDQHPIGATVLTWASFFILMSLQRRYPRYIGAFIVYTICMISVVGTKLIESKIGSSPYKKAGEVIYPMWLFAPYRALVVVAGCGIAFFWTIFPYPITERHALRMETSAALYDLIVYHDCCQAVAMTCWRSATQQLRPDSSPEAQRLLQMQRQTFLALHQRTSSLHQRLRNHKYELPIGGRFPGEKYAIILARIDALTEVATQIAYAPGDADSPPSASESNGGLEQGGEHDEPKGQDTDSSAWSAVDLHAAEDRTRRVSCYLAVLASCIKHATPVPMFPETFKNPVSNAIRRAEMVRPSVEVRPNNPSTVYSVLEILSDVVDQHVAALAGDVQGLVGLYDSSEPWRVNTTA